jgi:DNA-binding beta-propeller fold protein YncE
MPKSMQARTLRSRRRLAAVSLAALSLTLAGVGTSAAGPQRIVKFRTPTFPTEAVSAYGSIWVSTHRNVFVYRIDPKTNRITARINVVGDTCSLGASGGRVWAAGCAGGTISSIDPHTNKIVGGPQGFSALVGGGSLWVLTDLTPGTIARFDPNTNVRLKSFRLRSPAPPYIAGYAYGSLWVGPNGTDTVWRIDAATNTVTVIPLPGAKAYADPNQGYANGGPMSFAGGKAWTGNPAGIYEIDPATNRAKLLPISIGSLFEWGNIDMTAGYGSVWARTSGNQITRISPATGKVVRSYPATGGGGGIAVGFGSLWVTNASLDSVWREPIR